MKPFALFNQYKGLSREIYILGFQRFINSLGGFVFPFLGMLLKIKIGLSVDVVGQLIFLSFVAGIPGTLLAGKLVDKYSRKKILLIGQTGAALMFAICGFMEPTVAIAYVVIGASFMGSLARPASRAMVSDLTTPENRKQSFSLLYLGMNAGLAIGFLLAGILFENFWRWLFIGDALTSLISISLIAFLVKESKPTKEEEAVINRSDRIDEQTIKGHVGKAFQERPFLIAFVVISAITGFVYFQHGFIMPFQLEDLFVGQGAKLFGYIMLFNTIFVIVFTPLVMYLTRRYSPIVNMILATITYVIGFGMLGIVKEYEWFFVSCAIWTVGEIIATVNSGVYIANHSPVSHRGRFASWLELLHSSGRAFAPVFMGGYLLYHTYSEGWLLAGWVALGCTLAFWTLYIKEKKYKENRIRQIKIEDK